MSAEIITPHMIDVRRLSEAEFRAIVLHQLGIFYKLLMEIRNASNGPRTANSGVSNADADGNQVDAGTSCTSSSTPENFYGEETHERTEAPTIIRAPGANGEG